MQVDAIATARFDAQTGADREVQRILMELLNQMDGFDQTVNVKVRGGRAGRRACRRELWHEGKAEKQYAGVMLCCVHLHRYPTRRDPGYVTPRISPPGKPLPDHHGYPALLRPASLPWPYPPLPLAPPR